MAKQMSEKALKVSLRKEFKARIATIPKMIKEAHSRIVAEMVSKETFLFFFL